MRVIRYPDRSKGGEKASGHVGGLALDAKETGAAPDRYAEKLVKYVPAEVIAFYLPAYAYVQTAGNVTKWTVFGLGALGTVVYLLIRSEWSRLPHWYFFVLGVVAYVCWALGTSTIGTDLWGMSTMLSRITIAAAVFLIPGIDEILTRWTSDV